VLGDQRERQSSSGVLCATGTGCTGWARSIAEQRQLDAALPRSGDPELAWFVREPFPTVQTGTRLNFGLLAAGAELAIYSEMADGGVVFCDGIESDRVALASGQFVKVRTADRQLRLVVPA
jgi:hypothetical protein